MVLGIIAEYNPFHNGHLYHILKSKELTKDDYVIGKIENKDLEDRLNLTYVALRLYIESETSKLIADAIMNKLSKMVLPKEVFKESKKEVKYQNKKLGKEASKIGSSRKIKWKY